MQTVPTPVLVPVGYKADVSVLEGITATDILQIALLAQMDKWMDREAQTHGYDNIKSLCGYATDYEPNPVFRAEGVAGLVWKSKVYTAGIAILTECLQGLRPVPTPEELIAELPKMVWPSPTEQVRPSEDKPEGADAN